MTILNKVKNTNLLIKAIALSLFLLVFSFSSAKAGPGTYIYTYDGVTQTSGTIEAPANDSATLTVAIESVTALAGHSGVEVLAGTVFGSEAAVSPSSLTVDFNALGNTSFDVTLTTGDPETSSVFIIVGDSGDPDTSDSEDLVVGESGSDPEAEVQDSLGNEVTATSIPIGDSETFNVVVTGLEAGATYTISSSTSDNLTVDDDSIVVTADSAGEVSASIETTVTSGATVGISESWGVLVLDSGLSTVTSTSVLVTPSAGSTDPEAEVQDSLGNEVTATSIPIGDSETFNVVVTGLEAGATYTISSSTSDNLTVDDDSIVVTADSAGEVSASIETTVTSGATVGISESWGVLVLDSGLSTVTSTSVLVTPSAGSTDPSAKVVDDDTGLELDIVILEDLTDEDSLRATYSDLPTSEDTITVVVDEDSLPSGTTVSPTSITVPYDPDEGISDEAEFDFNTGTVGAGNLKMTVSTQDGFEQTFTTPMRVINDCTLVLNGSAVPTRGLSIDRDSDSDLYISGLDFFPGEDVTVEFDTPPSGFTFELEETTVESGEFTGDFQLVNNLSVSDSAPTGVQTFSFKINQANNRIGGTRTFTVDVDGDTPTPSLGLLDENKDPVTAINVEPGESVKVSMIPYDQPVNSPLELIGTTTFTDPTHATAVPASNQFSQLGDLFTTTMVTGQSEGSGTANFRIAKTTGADPVTTSVPYVVSTVTPQCSDGIDNDGDGLTDHPADCGCANAMDNDESDDPAVPIIDSIMVGNDILDPTTDSIVINASVTGNPVEVTLLLKGTPNSEGEIVSLVVSDESIASETLGGAELTFDDEGEASESFTLRGLAVGQTTLNVTLSNPCGEEIIQLISVDVQDPTDITITDPDGNTNEPFSVTPQRNVINVETFGLGDQPDGIFYSLGCAGGDVLDVQFNPASDDDVDGDGATRTEVALLINGSLPPGTSSTNCTFETISNNDLQTIVERAFQLEIVVAEVPSNSVSVPSAIVPRNNQPITRREALAIILNANATTISDLTLSQGAAVVDAANQFAANTRVTRAQMTQIIDNLTAIGEPIPSEFSSLSGSLNTTESMLSDLLESADNVSIGIRSANASSVTSAVVDMRTQFPALEIELALQQGIISGKQGKQVRRDLRNAGDDIGINNLIDNMDESLDLLVQLGAIF